MAENIGETLGALLRNNRVILLGCLNTPELIPWLIQTKVLTLNDVEEIQGRPTTAGRTSLLLDHVTHRIRCSKEKALNAIESLCRTQDKELITKVFGYNINLLPDCFYEKRPVHSGNTTIVLEDLFRTLKTEFSELAPVIETGGRIVRGRATVSLQLSEDKQATDIDFAPLLWCFGKRFGMTAAAVRNLRNYDNDAYKKAERKYILVRDQALGFLEMLNGHGFVISVNVAGGENITRLMVGLVRIINNLVTNSDFFTNEEYSLQVEQEMYQESEMTPLQKEVLLTMLVLMKINGTTCDFVIRKEGEGPTPNTYLVKITHKRELFKVSKVVVKEDYAELEEDYSKLSIRCKPKSKGTKSLFDI
jgi:hypothetical protein